MSATTFLLLSLTAVADTAVIAERVPGGGIQPQVLTAADGTVHLVYFHGDAAGGSAFYVRRSPEDPQWSRPLQINSQAGSVVAKGTIRGAQVALGKGNRMHVAWNGSGEAQPKGPDGQVPLLYTRMSDDGQSFEPQRNLISSAYGLDGGACIAADGAGSVYVAWHAGSGGGETRRRVYLTSSVDEGVSFNDERPIDVDRVGACGCCAMQGTVAPDGRLMFLYRAAKEGVHRDMYLLTSPDADATFSSSILDRWELSHCPMSSEAFVHVPSASYAAWQTQEQVFFARVDEVPQAATPAPGDGPQRKHPAMAVNNRGELLLVWTEGTGWNKGGSCAWQLFDQQGKPTNVRGRKAGLPVWSFAQPYVRADGVFVILY